MTSLVVPLLPRRDTLVLSLPVFVSPSLLFCLKCRAHGLAKTDDASNAKQQCGNDSNDSNDGKEGQEGITVIFHFLSLARAPARLAVVAQAVKITSARITHAVEPAEAAHALDRQISQSFMHFDWKIR
eukprot:CAMPEP_0185568646 /NCGR_PEP_ID=MMETSP0434-20130131/1544_1 /TAXON_ID=626734 ORGANISM="Favella taraikaensis, Strain Fe Narragansett Bay" /NCGR_SAMPLE_ID=MMETSP0434 /ASSEMBLY_ACC=CAM_ASM_000379 /LENGTH=127 /DNA_ID=CAMNT_0028183227 /DNA_START=526 /DNA_END=905 /DNA_ORIENTATION=-